LSAWTGGVVGRALQFRGVGDYVDAGADPVLDVNDQITVAAWVKTEDAANGEQNPFVTKGDYAYALKHFEGNCIEFFVYDASKPKQIGSGGWRSAQFVVDASFNGVWHHLAGTYDGSKVKLYIDGVMVNEVAYSGSIMLSPGTPLYIGANADWPDRGYEGAIDDVRIYDRALAGEEIAEIFQTRGGGSVTNLIGHWRLDGPGSHVTILADPVRAAIVAWPDGIYGTPLYWSPAADAFFRSIARQLP
jgi:beta-galactosidase